MDILSNVLLQEYFTDVPPGSVHTESYDHLVQHVIPDLVHNTPPLEIRQNPPSAGAPYRRRPVIFAIRFSGARYGLPGSRNENGGGQHGQTPAEARMRGSNYMMPMFVDVEVRNAKQQQQVYRGVYVGHVPVMVGSSVCTTRTARGKPVGSDDDPGGYFILNGMERTVVMQQKTAYNMAFVNACKSGVFKACRYSHEVEVRCALHEFNTTTSTFRIAARRGEPWLLDVSLPYVKYTFSWLLLLRALSVTADDIAVVMRSTWRNHLGGAGDEEHRVWFEEVALARVRDEYARVCAAHATAASAVGEMASTCCAPAIAPHTMRENLRKELLPHMGQGAEMLYAKGLAVVQLATRALLGARGLGRLLDKDHYGYKRVQTSGELLATLFRTAWGKLCKEVRAGVRKHISHHKTPDVLACIRPSTVTHAFTYAISTGNWNKAGARQSESNTGVSQVYNRFTTLSMLSYRTRVHCAVGKEGKVTKPRRVHLSQFNSICPSETPEGGPCGLVKNLAITCRVTVTGSADRVREALRDAGALMLEHVRTAHQLRTDAHWGHVVVNGAWVAVHSDVHALAAHLRALRRTERLAWDTGVYEDARARALYVRTDGGRVIYPLLRVDDDGCVHPLLRELVALIRDEQTRTRASVWELSQMRTRAQWAEWCGGVAARAILHRVGEHRALFEHLQREGAIEWIDGMEQENTLVAYTLEELERAGPAALYTHVQIDPVAFLGFCVFAIPGANHNQAPRNTYQASMGKQAVSGGVDAARRFDASSHQLHYPQKPLVCTKFDAMPHCGRGDEQLSGVNCIVAILCEPDNQEDSVCINRASVDRGLFRSSHYHTVSSEARRTQHVTDHFEVPAKSTRRFRDAAYAHLDTDGLPHVGARIEPGDVVIGKTRAYRNNRAQRSDCSLVLRASEAYYVDAVALTTSDANSDQNPVVRVRLRAQRVPEKGDKFSSRHGQKGVCGALVAPEDMPFTREGVVPDIVVNAHAFPSRMTIAQLLESVLGKVGVLLGGQVDFTPFGVADQHADEIGALLEPLGYERDGTERMYSGRTGLPLEARVFIGPTYYQRLRHMVRDKNHARAHGPIETLTRQPVEGRSREGGLRLGEMERDAILAHGAPAFLRDRMLDNSDRYETDVCSECGVIVSPTFHTREPTCPHCTGGRVHRVAIPYCTKLMSQELEAAHIGMRLRVNPARAQK